MLFCDLVDKFLKYQEQKLRFQTYLLMKRNFKLHIVPFFENYSIEQIDYEIYLDFKKNVKEKGYTVRFNNSLHSHMISFYEFLNAFYGISKNIPKIVGGFNEVEISREYVTWSISEFRRFRSVVDEIVYKYFFQFIYWNGVRIGEATALTFSNCLKNYKYAKICESLSKELKDGKKQKTPTKNGKTRYIRLDIFVRFSIWRLKKYYIKKYGYFDENFYVFGGKESLSRTTIKRKKDKWCEKANVSQIRIHDLRHSHATILYQKKVPIKLIQERLGHSSITTTMNTYVHTNEEQEKKVLRTLNFLHVRFF